MFKKKNKFILGIIFFFIGLFCFFPKENAENIIKLGDCCSSATQWALGSKKLDFAFLCPVITSSFLKKNQEFEIIGKTVVNGELILTRKSKNQDIDEIFYSKGRLEQYKMLKNNFSENIKIKSLSSTALIYALEKREIDTAVINYNMLENLKGEYRVIPYNGEYVSYILVGRKKMKNSLKYKKFIEQQNKKTEVLKNKNWNYKNIEGVENWKPIFIKI